jgi:hypothetical protein
MDGKVEVRSDSTEEVKEMTRSFGGASMIGGGYHDRIIESAYKIHLLWVVECGPANGSRASFSPWCQRH